MVLNMALVDFNPHTENDKFYYIEGSTSVKDFVKNIANELVTNAGDNYKWTQEFPTSGTEIVDKVILSTTTSYSKTFYLKIERPAPVAPATKQICFVNLSIGTTLNTAKDDFVDNTESPKGKLSWYTDDIDDSIDDWLPINYWLECDKDHFNLILRGDPSADNYAYNRFLMGHAYVGSLTPLSSTQEVDDQYNFGITASSSTEPDYTNTYGPRTATSITDVCMIANKIGMPMQPHYPEFDTINPFADKLNIEGSRWVNQQHQFSDVILFHPVDMQRGKMRNILVGDPSAIYDNDKLVMNENTKNQVMYKKFKITAPFNFLVNSPNPKYCIAIRCYNEDKTIQVDDGN